MRYDLKQKSDNELMDAFSKCSSEAFEEIMNRYKKRLFNYLLCGLISNRQEAEDIVQETFIRAFKSKFTYRFTYQFSTWIYTICRNLALNVKRNGKYSRTNTIENEEEYGNEAKNFSRSMEENEISDIMKESLLKLDKKYKDIIVLRYLEGLSYEEISKVTGIGQNTLKSQCKRGIEQIRREMESKKIEMY